jgi:hypothetical protein
VTFLLLVQGKKSSLDSWMPIVSKMSFFEGNVQRERIWFETTMIFLAFDSQIDSSGPWGFSFHEANTTWTVGRNFLIRKGYRFEEENDKRYDFWVFSDEDPVLQCKPIVLQQDGSCWRSYLRMLYRCNMPLVSVAFTHQIESLFKSSPAKGAENEEFMLVDGFDAILNAFHRESLKIFLPYSSLSDSFSWWISQSVVNLIARICMPVSTMVPREISVINPQHSSGYPRGRNSTYEKKIVLSFFVDYCDLPTQQISEAILTEQMMVNYDFFRGPFRQAHVGSYIINPHTRCKCLMSRFQDFISGKISV